MNKATSGFFALTQITDPSKHVDYNWWHASDHQPENLALDGVVYAARWAATNRLAAARLGAHPALASKQYLGHYMMRDPVDRAIEDFSALSRRTAAEGRSFPNRSIVTFGHHKLMKAYTADRVVVSPEGLPWRPHTGVFCTIKHLRDASFDDEIAHWHDEIHVPDMLTVPGVAGCYWFRNEGQPAASIPDAGIAAPLGGAVRRHVWLYYLDGDPVDVMGEVARRIPDWRAAGRGSDPNWPLEAVLAAPFETIHPIHAYDLPAL